MRRRIVCHVALNAKNQQVGVLINVCGRLVRMSLFIPSQFLRLSTKNWMNEDWFITKSVADWKDRIVKPRGAVRYQRVIIEGDFPQ